MLMAVLWAQLQSLGCKQQRLRPEEQDETQQQLLQHAFATALASLQLHPAGPGWLHQQHEATAGLNSWQSRWQAIVQVLLEVSLL
jgi:hypothetical protein